MKKSYVLLILVLVLSFAVVLTSNMACRGNNAPKAGEKLDVKMYHELQVVRGKVLSKGTVIPGGWGLVEVVNPDDNRDYLFTRMVMVMKSGIASGGSLVIENQFKTGDNIVFTLISTQGNPIPVSEATIASNAINMAMQVDYNEKTMTMTNPPKK